MLDTEKEEGQQIVEEQLEGLISKIRTDIKGAIGTMVLVLRIEESDVIIGQHRLGMIPDCAYQDLQYAAMTFAADEELLQQ